MSIGEMGNRSIGDLLAERVALAPERTFLVFESRAGEVSELTYAEFDGRVEDCARGLHALGVAAGDRVVVHLRNSPEFLVSLVRDHPPRRGDGAVEHRQHRR